MQDVRGSTLVFPTAERRQRLRIGGVLFIILGIILIGVAWLTGEGIFKYFGGIMILAGIFASGYRNQVLIHPEIGVIKTLKGVFFFLRRGAYQRSEFQKVVVRKSVSQSSGFSNASNQTYESRIKVNYAVVLVGMKEVKVDSTEDHKAADQWAEQIGDVLNLTVEQEEERSDKADI